jgi:hypothetical protein
MWGIRRRAGRSGKRPAPPSRGDNFFQKSEIAGKMFARWQPAARADQEKTRFKIWNRRFWDFAPSLPNRFIFDSQETA